MKTGISFRAGLIPCAFALLVLATGCRTPREPRSDVEFRYPWGVAAARTDDDALRLAAIVDTTLAVYRNIPGFSQRPLRVHLNEFRRPTDFAVGISVEPWSGHPWIAVSPNSSEVEHTTAHEMAHFYFREVHDVFPVVLEEGFCDLLAERVFPGSTSSDHQIAIAAMSYLDEVTIVTKGDDWRNTLAYLIQDAPTIDQALEVSNRDHLHASARHIDTHYGLGLTLARRIGVNRLLELSARARAEGLPTVPAAWIRVAAGIEPQSQDNLRALFAAAMGGSVDGQFTLTLSDGGD